MSNSNTPTVPIQDIEIGERFRKDYGEIDQLCYSIQKNGLISPVAVGLTSKVNIVTETTKPYVLLAGGRRMEALKILKWTDIPVRIYDQPISVLDLRSIELAENMDRKDMSHEEKLLLVLEIHNLQESIHGKKILRTSNAPGWSQADTAKLLGKSPSSVALDLNLANAMVKYPELELNKCKNKAEAVKKFKEVTKVIGNNIAATEYTNSTGASNSKIFKKLSSSYIIGDCLSTFKNIPTSSMDFIEIDPPYAIDLVKNKKDNSCTGYNEIPVVEYTTLISQVLSESYRVLKNDSWLLMWFGPDPWFQPMASMIQEANFKMNLIPALWTKPQGQTMQPETYLGNSYEMFFYARKGQPKLQKPGCSNIFNYRPVSPTDKYHPTQKPLELMQEIYSTFVKPMSMGYIPFAGSGVGLLAGHLNKINMIGTDLTQAFKDGYILELQSLLGE